MFVAAGDVRISPKKVKELLGGRPKMATPEQVKNVTGFEVGAVCPFALAKEVPIFVDESLKRFDMVYTAAGIPESLLLITFEKLVAITKGTVIDLAKA